MEFAKDEILDIKYKEENYKKENKLSKFILNHKFILTLSILGLAVCSINGVLIYNFIKVLSTLNI